MPVRRELGALLSMLIPFSYPKVPALEVPEANLMSILSPRAEEPARPVSAMAEEALDHPAGCPPVEQLASSSGRILILVDDITRQTPAWAVLPPLLRRLANQGVRENDVRILIASGTHSRMTEQDVEKKLGPTIPRRHAVSIHHWKAAENLAQIGTTGDGTPIQVNRMLSEADLVIGVGQIVPHRVMGFTGGASIVQPGVSGPQITGYTHWMSALYSGGEILGIADNPVRVEVERIARLAGLKFILNVVMDAEGRVLQVVAGDPVAAHRQGAEFSRAIYGVPQPSLADIVVAESYPADYDLWQAAKGIYSSELAVREGGAVILITPCPHGVSIEHPEVEEIGYLSFKEVRARVEKKSIVDLVAAAHLVHVGRVIRDRAHGIMVSPGIAPATQFRLGFKTAATPQQALEIAFSLCGRDAKVVILRHGGDVLPLVPGQKSEATKD